MNVNSSDRTPFDDICSERTPNEIYNKLLATCKRFQAEKNISLLLKALQKFYDSNSLERDECQENIMHMLLLVEEHINDDSTLSKHSEIEVVKALTNLTPLEFQKKYGEEK